MLPKTSIWIFFELLRKKILLTMFHTILKDEYWEILKPTFSELSTYDKENLI